MTMACRVTEPAGINQRNPEIWCRWIEGPAVLRKTANLPVPAIQLVRFQGERSTAPPQPRFVEGERTLQVGGGRRVPECLPSFPRDHARCLNLPPVTGSRDTDPRHDSK